MCKHAVLLQRQAYFCWSNKCMVTICMIFFLIKFLAASIELVDLCFNWIQWKSVFWQRHVCYATLFFFFLKKKTELSLSLIRYVQSGPCHLSHIGSQLKGSCFQLSICPQTISCNKITTIGRFGSKFRCFCGNCGNRMFLSECLWTVTPLWPRMIIASSQQNSKTAANSYF